MADRIEWTPRRGTCTSAAARSAPRSRPEATPVAPRRHGASTYVSRVDGRRGDGSARPLELRTGSEPSGANGSRRRPTMPTRVRRAPIAATPTAQRARSRDVVRRWGRSQRDSGAGDGGTPPRHAPTADGGDLDGRASRSSLAPAPNAAAPADDRHYPRRLHRGCPPRPERARARAGHSAHAATAVALGPHAPVMRRRRPAQRQRATTGLLSAEGHLQEKWPRRGPYEGARARKPNEVIRRPYPSSASKTGLGCGRDDDARSSYEAPGMIGQATTSSETPSITSVAGYGEMPKCGKLPGAPPVLTLKQRQLFIMIESSELRGSTTTLEVLWVVVPND